MKNKFKIITYLQKNNYYFEEKQIAYMIPITLVIDMSNKEDKSYYNTLTSTLAINEIIDNVDFEIPEEAKDYFSQKV